MPAREREPVDLHSALVAFERQVYARKGAAAFASLESILKRLDGGAPATRRLPDAEVQALSTRLVAAAVALLAAPEGRLDLARYRRLATYKRTLTNAIGASAYDAASLAALLGVRSDKDGRRRFPTEALPALLLLMPQSELALLAGALPRVGPQWRLPFLLGCLSEQVVVTAAQARGRNWLIEHSALFDDCELAADESTVLSPVWMYCSYADHPRKHEVKAALNRLLERWLERAIGRPAAQLPRAAARASGERPVIAVVTERFREHHAMFRCYAPSLSQLRERFRVVLFADRRHVDDAARQVADEIVPVDPAPGRIADAVAAIEAVAPDMVHFSSVGMSFWSICLANVRLAPIQLMSLGHPASSMSSSIDYVVMGRALADSPACFSERVVLRKVLGNPHAPHPGYLRSEPQIRARPEVLRIGVPSMANKLSAAFVELCATLRSRSRRALAFDFFPNVAGAAYHHLRRVLPECVPGATVHAIKPYAEYMSALAHCDLVLASFPFGNSNSTVDALLLARPVIAMIGDEPSERTDQRMMRSAGVPLDLLCRTREAYLDTALRLVENDGMRVAASQAIARSDPYRSLYEDDHDLHPGDFVETIDWIRRNHERIVADGRRLWTPEDRDALT